MTVIVSRHFTPGATEEEWAERLGACVVRDIDELEEYPHSLAMVFNDALLHLGARCTVDPRAAKVETWEAVVSTLELGSALFATVAADQGTVECRINGEMHTLPITGRVSNADLGTWLTTFWLAVVCRDQRRMTELAQVPLDRIDAIEFDEYVRHWVDTLQTYWLQGPDLVEKLALASPDVATIAPRGLLETVLAPPIHLFYLFYLFYLFVTNNPAGFNEFLVQTLKLHQAYWTDEQRAEKPDSHLALAPPWPWPASHTTAECRSRSNPDTCRTTCSPAAGWASSPRCPVGAPGPVLLEPRGELRTGISTEEDASGALCSAS